MNLSLKKPIVFFDLETTGVNVAKDRIVEISIFKAFPNKSTESKTWLVNPTVPIPAEVTEVHGISDQDVVNAPTFKEIAHEIKNIMEGCDLAGYNSNKFDIPFFGRRIFEIDVDIDLKKHHAVDVQNIFHKMEQRTLSAAYQFYCNKNLDNAHSAEADTKAIEILNAQIERYDELENDIEFLSTFSNRGKRTVDMGFHHPSNDKDEACFSFGKYKDKQWLAFLKQIQVIFHGYSKPIFLYTKRY